MSEAVGLFPRHRMEGTQGNLAPLSTILPMLMATRGMCARLHGEWRGCPGVSGGAIRPCLEVNYLEMNASKGIHTGYLPALGPVVQL